MSNVIDTTVLDLVRQTAPAAVLEPADAIDMPTAYVSREHIVDVCRALRDHAGLQFSFLVEITAVDYHPAEPRYEVVYHLACLGEAFAQPGGAAPARRLRLKVRVPETDPRVPTLTGVWPAANWLEREVYDLFGIVFTGHPDLRRILTPDDWTGHPLRKDYPVQVRKDAAAWSPMELTPEEFAANIQAARAASARLAQKPD
ncbi:MAG: NADH-quinone oxidoreductase subunit C [Acidimicrobiia bacterium]|nr:NADH-quinone oxidoreductase subunit C [Acidimicrobiia bacterium]